MQTLYLKPSFLKANFYKCVLLIIGNFIFAQLAFANIVLPDVNPKYVSIQESNPTRDAGFVVGDILDRTITLTIKKPYQ
ncbi:MAG: hypothetical protein ABL859_00025 [Methylotenera sp.]